MRGIIWYYTSKEDGFERFNQLVQEYEQMKIPCTHKIMASTVCEASFENGDSWSLVPSRKSIRGHRCNVALIERGTPEKIIQTRIMPSLIWSPYRAYNYW